MLNPGAQLSRYFPRMYASYAYCSPAFLTNVPSHRPAIYSYTGKSYTLYGQLRDDAVQTAVSINSILPLRNIPKLLRSMCEKSDSNRTGNVSTFFDQPRVALLCECEDFTFAAFAVWMVKGIVVPLCKSHPIKEQVYVLKDSAASLIIASEEFQERARELGRICEIDYIFPVLAIDAVTNGQPRSFNCVTELSASQYQSLGAMIMYTSGTTGKPKGVLTTHRNLSAQMSMLLEAWHWSKDDTVLHALPLHHVHGVLNALLCPLAVGATCLMMRQFQPADVWKVLLNEDPSLPKVTVFTGVPTMYAKLMEYYNEHYQGQKHYIKEYLKENIRLMISGSAPLPVTLFKKWADITGHKLLERYGMTEVGMALSNPTNGERIPGSVGQALPTVSVRLAGVEQSQLTQNGPENKSESVGELQLKGPAIFTGYWNRPEETRASFTDDGWFKTGDVAALCSSYYYLKGRMSSDIIKSKGYKISALEIEHVLYDHQGVKECAVIGVPDALNGESIVAVIVLQNDITLTMDGIKEFCRLYLAHYKIPQQIYVVKELPKNILGKTSKKDLIKSIQLSD